MSYPTVRAAGIAGTLEALRKARLNGWEYGGYIIRNSDGTFGFSTIVTSRDPHTVSLFEAIPPGIIVDTSSEGILQVNADQWRTIIAGMFHVHIAYAEEGYGLKHEWFSPADISTAAYSGGFAYLGAAKHGRIFEVDARSKEAFIDSIAERDMDIEIRNGVAVPVALAKGKLVYEEGKGLIL